LVLPSPHQKPLFIIYGEKMPLKETNPVRAWRLIHQEKITNPQKVSKNPGHNAWQRIREPVGVTIFKEKMRNFKPKLELPAPRTRLEKSFK
jgi:hypothetical protein